MNLGALRRNTPVAIWLALMLATLLSFAFGDGLGPARVAAVAVLLVAYAKVNLIGRYFMELNGAPKGLQVGFLAFTVVTGAGLILLDLAGA
jgi:Prokaryotic Cytochrome C oxidase subunit IV